MKKILLLVLILLSIFLGYSLGFNKDGNGTVQNLTNPKNEIMKVALIADSHNENDLLAKALAQAKEQNVDFVIGLGDYTNLGTDDEIYSAKKAFDDSGVKFYTLAGDRDGWDNREHGEYNLTNYNQYFGPGSQEFTQKEIRFVLIDNSNLYLGIPSVDWDLINQWIKGVYNPIPGSGASPIPMEESKLTFVFAHKTPFHPDSAHIMGEDSPMVAEEANQLIKLIEEKKVDGFFSGDLHFFAQFNSPGGSVKMATIGAVASQRNFQGPRFAILKVYSDYSWEVLDVPIN